MEWFTPPSCPLTQKSTLLSLQIHPYKPCWVWSEVSAVCRELKCHFPHVPFRGSTRCPVTNHIHRTGLACCSFNKLHGFPHGMVLTFLNKFWFYTLRIPAVCQKKDDNLPPQVLTLQWQISCMLQDTLNSCGTQFHCFNLNRSINTRSRKVFLALLIS